MSPRTGRPKSDNPKSNPIHVRLDNETQEILEKYCQQEDIPKTEGIRRGIYKLKSEIKKNQPLHRPKFSDCLAIEVSFYRIL